MTHTRVFTRAVVNTPAPVLMTAEELLADPLPNARIELVRGQSVVREPAKLRHGDVAARALIAVSAHLTEDLQNSRPTLSSRCFHRPIAPAKC